MSADLLAEFGQDSGSAQSSAGRSQAAQPQANSLIDDLGQSNDFFSAVGSGGLQDRPHHLNARAQPSQQRPTFQTFDLPRRHDSDVLFDATLDAPTPDTEDDWGEFEGPESSVQPAPTQTPTPAQTIRTSASQSQPRQNQSTSGTIDLLDSLSIEDSKPASNQHIQGVSKSNFQPQSNNPPTDSTWDDDSFDDWGDFADGTASTTIEAKPTPKKQQTPIKPAAPQPTWDDDEDWGDFDDGPSTTPAPQPSATSRPSSIIPGAQSTSPAIVRPTNIPPPSVLLELLVDIFNKLQKEGAKAKARDAPESTKTSTASRIHNTLQTAARIIAGRTLRWKRDTILSQSMRIGPARAGKSSGMKLSAVNKQEDVKEKQDAVDVLSLWRERSALFNTVVQAAGRRPIPAVADPSALKVITARAEQGAIKASHPCALCALKRDERVLKLDEENVQDSFGEWWTEHWGHTACREFWETNQGLLGQR